MKDPRHYCIIMAGGVGKRFWPVSRRALPKQFLSYGLPGTSFLKMAAERVRTFIRDENIVVVTLERYRSLVEEDLPWLRPENLLLEPFNRNTASCIIYANSVILGRDPAATVLVTPSDQVIDDVPQFRSTCLRGLAYAGTHNVLMTLGVLPTRPDTNFGYIQTDAPMLDGSPIHVKTFTEKPEKELAQVFIDSGEFLWNAGIFMWQASVFRTEVNLHAKELADQWRGWEAYLGTPAEKDYLRRIYPGMPRTSIDYALLEKSGNVMAIPAFFDWDDLGNWESVYEYFSRGDVSGNAIRTAGKLVARDNNGSMIFSPIANKLLIIKGLENYTVIDTDNVLMICPRGDKEMEEVLAETSLPEYEEFR